MNDATPHVLLLGGSAEASRFAALLAADDRFRATLSLAGATRRPAPSPLPCRIGGFGGADGLAAWVERERVAAIVDATHPFATGMNRNARAAAARTGATLLRLTRPPWRAGPDDRWIEVADAAAAAAALGPAPRRVLLTIGRRDLDPFRAGPHRLTIRAVDLPAPDAVPPGARVLVARGPFALDDERALFGRERFDALVTKNSGGDATGAKLVAAREHGADVFMIRRPPDADPPGALHDPEAALRALARLCPV